MHVHVEACAGHGAMIVDVLLQAPEQGDPVADDGAAAEGDPQLPGLLVGHEQVVAREILVAEREPDDLRDGGLLEAATGERAELVDGVHADEQGVGLRARIGPRSHA